MSVRCSYQTSTEIGVFSLLTNRYCLTAAAQSENFYSVFEEKLIKDIPVVHATVADTICVGTLCAGNSKGLLLPRTTTDQEMLHIRTSLPDSVVVQRVEERISALGNIITCNDHVALVHPEVDRETEEIIADVLGVEVFRYSLLDNPLVGSYVRFTNRGGIVHPMTPVHQLDELAALLNVPLVAGTCNRGSVSVGKGVVVNDWACFVGSDTTSTELAVIEAIFGIAPEKNINLDEALLFQ